MYVYFFRNMQDGSQYARDYRGEWVNAVDTPKVRGVRYTCGCPDQHVVKLVKPLGLGKREFRDYFSHVSKRHSDGEFRACRGGGESESHRNAKHRLREMQGQFWFVVARCSECTFRRIERCRDGVIVVEMVSDDRRWRYDCMLLRDGVPQVALEVVKTHFSSDEKIDQTRGSGVEIAEFLVEDVMDLEPGGELRNLRVRVMLCDACTADMDQQWLERCWWDDVNTLHALDSKIRHERQKQWDRERAAIAEQARERQRELERRREAIAERQRQFERQRAERQRWLEEALEERAAAEAERIWAERKSDRDWMLACWEREWTQFLTNDADKDNAILEMERLLDERNWLHAHWESEQRQMGVFDSQWGANYEKHVEKERLRKEWDEWGKQARLEDLRREEINRKRCLQKSDAAKKWKKTKKWGWIQE